MDHRIEEAAIAYLNTMRGFGKKVYGPAHPDALVFLAGAHFALELAAKHIVSEFMYGSEACAARIKELLDDNQS